jgi:tetrapyrrole methylase family protein/MazG family protein
VIEEAYEVVDAIDRGQDEDISEELGDLLLQVVFQAQIASDRDAFDIEDVAGKLVAKLKRRHPHIFSIAEAETADEVRCNWHKIKEAEGKYDKSLLTGIPRDLPALFRAYKIQKKMEAAGFDWEDEAALTAAVEAEADELRRALAGDGDIREEIGDMLFMLANIARRRGVEPEDALRYTNRKIEARFRFMEKRAAEAGAKLADLSLAEQEELWQEAKREEQ